MELIRLTKRVTEGLLPTFIQHNKQVVRVLNLFDLHKSTSKLCEVLITSN